MTFKISGFGADMKEQKGSVPVYQAARGTLVPRKSLVQVRFPGRGMAYKGLEEIVSHIGPTAQISQRIRPVYNFKAAE